MNRYVHTTRECSISQLDAGLLQAIREYFQVHQLGDPETAVRMCCETIASEHGSGRLAAFLDGNPDSTIHLGLLLTEDWLIWARRGDISGTVINGTRLIGLKVKTVITRRTKNMQLDITGIIGGTKNWARGSLEMGPELAAQKFCEEVERAVNTVNPPVKKSQLRWFGG
jgi:hypothetical protein